MQCIYSPLNLFNWNHSIATVNKTFQAKKSRKLFAPRINRLKPWNSFGDGEIPDGGVDKATASLSLSLHVAEAWRVNEWIFRRIRANHGPVTPTSVGKRETSRGRHKSSSTRRIDRYCASRPCQNYTER